MIKITFNELSGNVVAMLDGGAIGTSHVRAPHISKYNTEKTFRAFMNLCALEALQLFINNEIDKEIFINKEILTNAPQRTKGMGGM